MRSFGNVIAGAALRRAGGRPVRLDMVSAGCRFDYSETPEHIVQKAVDLLETN